MGKDIKEYFTNKVIKVDRGGPESRIGKLLDAGDDYFAVLTEDDGVVYYHTQHIKSFTENRNMQLEFDVKVPKDFEFKKAENFKELLQSLSYLWVRINRGGPDMVEGILIEVKDDFVYIITNDEVVRITIFHIKNVSYGPKIEKAKTEDHKSQEPKSQEPKSLKPKTLKPKTLKPKTLKPKTLKPKTLQTESLQHESPQRLNDESKNKHNKTNVVGRQNFDEDLTVLLSSMEKFLRNYSKGI
ncbi:hypothetical protein FB550_111109 [Neobacillus bataviensis]|uniref:Spore coat protein B n=1 Tax=Neobacillus bataviensis TaxID=220685 RepID=A0A561CZE7_9BACI|nr:hypothetical protein [Neobacillus bataviensis]TWD96452.1 hypothetical protein FB550_111109 [Neobacillus bataviensis]